MNKHVSIILLVIVALTLPTAVCGQSVYKLSHGEASRDMEIAMLHKGLYLGQYEGMHCWAGQGEKGVKQVALVDDNLNVKEAVTLPEASRYCEFMSATLRDGEAHLVMVDSCAEGRTVVYAVAVNLAALDSGDNALSIKTIDSLTYGPKDRCYVWTAVSPNGMLVGKVVVVQYIEKQQYSALAQIYDWKLERLWEKEYAVGTMEHLYVTDLGELVSLGYENYVGETQFIYNIISEHKANTYAATVECYPVRQLEMAGMLGRKVMGVGLFAPADRSEKENLCGGTMGLAFDIDSASLSGLTMRPFQNEDINILLNKKTKTVQTEQILDLVSVAGVTLTDYGAALAVGRNWRANIVEDNGVPFHTHNRLGLHIASFDTNGNVRWARNIRRNDIERDGDEMLTVGLMSKGDTVTVVKAEYPRTPVTYDVSQKVKPLIAGKKSNMALYTIAPNGDVAKWMLVLKKKQGLIRSIMRPDGSILLVTGDGKNMRLTKVERTW